MAVRSGNHRPAAERNDRSNRSTGVQEFRADHSTGGGANRGWNGGRRPDQNQHQQRRFGSERRRPQCTYCKELGHWVQTCYKLHGYPEGHPKAGTNSDPKMYKDAAANYVSEEERLVSISENHLKQLLSLIPKTHDEGSSSKANAVTKPTKPGLFKVVSCNWIIDSGATDHFTSSSNLLHKIQNCSLPSVSLPSGERAKIVAKGSGFKEDDWFG